MKQRLTILSLLFTLMVTAVWADDAKVIVWLNNGSKTEIPFTEMPQFVYATGTFKVIAGSTTYSWPLADLKELTFESALPSFVFNDTDDNSTPIVDKDNTKCNITLDRTLQTGSYNTFSVPFNISADMVKTVLGKGSEGTVIKELTGSSLTGNKLGLTFADATSIVAGKPYLIKVPAQVQNPTFEGITIVKGSMPKVTGYVDFVPTMGKTLVVGTSGNENNPQSVLFLAGGNQFKHPTVVNQPDNEDSYQKGFRAYFRLHEDAMSAIEFTSNLDENLTGILDVRSQMEDGRSDIFDMQGRKVQSPAKKGIYIMNGRKIVVR